MSVEAGFKKFMDELNARDFTARQLLICDTGHFLLIENAEILSSTHNTVEMKYGDHKKPVDVSLIELVARKEELLKKSLPHNTTTAAIKLLTL